MSSWGNDASVHAVNARNVHHGCHDSRVLWFGLVLQQNHRKPHPIEEKAETRTVDRRAPKPRPCEGNHLQRQAKRTPREMLGEPCLIHKAANTDISSLLRVGV